MILTLIIALPVLAAVLIVAGVADKYKIAPITAGLAALGVDALILLVTWVELKPDASGVRFLDLNLPWIAQLGIHFHLTLDSIALLFCILTLAGGALSLFFCQLEKSVRPAGLTALLLASVSGMLGVFLAQDLFLFFIFYEIILIPAYFLILLYAESKAKAAAAKFLIFTQTGGLLLLLSIVALVSLHAAKSGAYTFDAEELMGTTDGGWYSVLLLAGFFVAFAIKLPIAPFHLWQPDTYAALPTGPAIFLGSVISKAAAYGMIRFATPLFPEAAHILAPYALGLAAFSLVYCSVTAFGQRDLHRLIAYSSAAHLSLIVFSAFALNPLAHTGAILQMLSHSVSVAGLFLVAGFLRMQYGTRNLDELGGVWNSAPRMGFFAIAFAMASLGLPGLGNFLGEFLSLAGAFALYPIPTAIAATGAVLSAIYSLSFIQQIFLGNRSASLSVAQASPPASPTDFAQASPPASLSGIAQASPPALRGGEAPRPILLIAAALLLLLLGLGLHPHPVIRMSNPTENAVLRKVDTLRTPEKNDGLAGQHGRPAHDLFSSVSRHGRDAHAPLKSESSLTEDLQ